MIPKVVEPTPTVSDKGAPLASGGGGGVKQVRKNRTNKLEDKPKSQQLQRQGRQDATADQSQRRITLLPTRANLKDIWDLSVWH